MKNFLLTCLLGFTALASQAQIADYSYAPNLVDSTYPDRQAYDLHAVLDSGFTVIVDVMATWCGPCWSWHTGNYFKQLDALYGPNGTNELRVLMVEADSRTPEDLLSRVASGGTAATTSLGDWTEGINYPIIDNDQFADDYNIGYFPTIYAISPNRMVYEIGRYTDPAVYQRYAQEALGVATAGPNAAALSYTGAKDVCGRDASTSALIQNLSTESATGIIVRLVDQSGAVVVERTLTNTLTPYQIVSVNIGDIPAAMFDDGQLDLNLQVEIAGDLRDSDNVVEGIKIGSPVSVSESVTLEFTTDFWCAETGLRVIDGDNTVLLSETYSGDANNGGGADANKTFTYVIPVENTDPACWTFNVTDSYGDGANQYPTGAPIPGMTLLNSEGEIVFERSFVDETFETATTQSAKLSTVVSGTQTPVASEINVFPNPAAAGNVVVVELAGLTSTGDINARLINAVGQTVHSYNASAANDLLTFELPQGLSGMYFLELSSTAGTSVQRLTVK